MRTSSEALWSGAGWDKTALFPPSPAESPRPPSGLDHQGKTYSWVFHNEYACTAKVKNEKVSHLLSMSAQLTKCEQGEQGGGDPCSIIS